MNLANSSCRSHPTTTCNALLQRQLRARRPPTFTSCLGKIECRSHECRRRFQALSANDKRCAQATRCGEPDKIPLQEATPYTTKQLRERSRPTPIARAESVRKDGFGDDACFIPLPSLRRHQTPLSIRNIECAGQCCIRHTFIEGLSKTIERGDGTPLRPCSIHTTPTGMCLPQMALRHKQVSKAITDGCERPQ